MKILAFESSCDETAVAVVEDGRTVLSDAIASQADMHALYGELGFRSVGRRKNYYEHPKEDALIMTKEFDYGTATADAGTTGASV